MLFVLHAVGCVGGRGLGQSNRILCHRLRKCIGGVAAASPCAIPSLESLTVEQLKARLREHGLPLGGRKLELVQRLDGFYVDKASEADASELSKAAAAIAVDSAKSLDSFPPSEDIQAIPSSSSETQQFTPRQLSEELEETAEEVGFDEEETSSESSSASSSVAMTPRERAREVILQLRGWAQGGSLLQPADLGAALVSLAQLRCSKDRLDEPQRQYLLAQLRDAAARTGGPAWGATALVRIFYGLRAWTGPDWETILDAAASRLLLREPYETVSPRGLAMISLGFQFGAVDCPTLRRVLGEVAQRLERGPTGMSADSICRVLSGLRCVPDCDETKAVLRAVAPRINECTDVAHAVDLGYALRGLNRIGDSPELRAVVGSLAKLVSLCPEPFSGQQVATAIVGIQGCGESPELKALWAALASRIDGPGGSSTVKAIDVSNCFMAFRKWKDDSDLRLLITSLAKHLDALKGRPMTLSEACSAVHGLQRCRISAASRHALRGLAALIDVAAEPPSPQDIKAGLYGLQRAGDSPESRSVLAALARKIEVCRDHFPSQAICLSLYGLRCFGSGPELNAVLGALAPHIAASLPWTSQGIATALYGLQLCEDSAELRTVLAALAPKVAGCTECLNDQEIGMTFSGFHTFGDKCPEVRPLMAAVTTKLGPGQPLSAKSFEMVASGLRSLIAGGDCDELRALMLAIESRAPLPDTLGQVAPKPLSRLRSALRESTSEEAARLLGVLRTHRVSKGGRQHATSTDQRASARAGVIVLPTTSPCLQLQDDCPLPLGWSRHWRGDVPYYYHADHGSQWTIPSPSRPQSKLPEGWSAHQAPNGQTYYYHPDFGSQWQVPSVS